MIGWSVRSASGDCRVDGTSGDRGTAWSEAGAVSEELAVREDVVLVLEVGDERVDLSGPGIAQRGGRDLGTRAGRDRPDGLIATLHFPPRETRDEYGCAGSMNP